MHPVVCRAIPIASIAIFFFAWSACNLFPAATTDCSRDGECPTGYRCVGSPGLCTLASATDAARIVRDDGAPADSGAQGSDAEAGERSPFDGAAARDRTSLDTGGHEHVGVDVGGADRTVIDTSPDTAPPPPLDRFEGQTGANPAEIALTIDFPASTDDYEHVVILRTAGFSAPPSTCASGDPVVVFNTGEFVDQQYVDGGLVLDAFYSYRVCIYDPSGNLTSLQTAENVQARGCLIVDVAAEAHQDLKASIMDAYLFQYKGNSEGWAPVQIFSGTAYDPDGVIALTGVSGVSICRIYPSGTSQIYCGPIDCPEQWKLFFLRQDGSVILDGTPENLSDFVSGVSVPAGAVSAWIGFRDGEPPCATGADCTESATKYFDNEGLRSTTNPQSTNGCDFTFEYRRLRCR